jgi:hypothetical protein
VTSDYRPVTLYRLAWLLDCLFRGEAPGTDGPPRCWLPGSLVDMSLYGGALYRRELIRYQSDHDDYACSHSKVAMSGCDGMGLSTRVPIAKRV